MGEAPSSHPGPVQDMDEGSGSPPQKKGEKPDPSSVRQAPTDQLRGRRAEPFL